MQKRTGEVVENTGSVFRFTQKRTGELPLNCHDSQGKMSKNGNLVGEAPWRAAADLLRLRRGHHPAPRHLIGSRVSEGGSLAAPPQIAGGAGKEKRNIKMQERTGEVVENTGSVLRFTQKRTGELALKGHLSQGEGRQGEAGPRGAGKEGLAHGDLLEASAERKSPMPELT